MPTITIRVQQPDLEKGHHVIYKSPIAIHRLVFVDMMYM